MRLQDNEQTRTVTEILSEETMVRTYLLNSPTALILRIQAGTDSPAKRPGFHNRMITVLIHDMRSGKVDRQLAEVTIPVKMADDPQDGFWADARDIVSSGASVFTIIDLTLNRARNCSLVHLELTVCSSMS